MTTTVAAPPNKVFCCQCGSVLVESDPFCIGCGSRQPVSLQAVEPMFPEPRAIRVEAAPLYAIHPRLAMLALFLDFFLFALEMKSRGRSAAVLFLPVSVAFGLIAYRVQRCFGDHAPVAKLKAAAMGVLLAFPTILPAFVYVPAGIRGWAWLVRRKREFARM